MITSPPPSLHHHYLNLQLMTCQFVRRLIDIKHDFLTASEAQILSAPGCGPTGFVILKRLRDELL
jgi:hypothetical protein